MTEKLGDLTLRDLIESEGKREVSNTLKASLAEAQSDISRIEALIRDSTQQLQMLQNRDRTARIVGRYKQSMASYLARLNVHTLESRSFEKIDCSVAETSSDQPRALFAYFVAMLETIREFGSSNFCLVVIDAPNQQEQDRGNREAILRFIKDNRPEGCQLVLGLVDDFGVDFGGETIDMTARYRGLRESDYSTLADELRPFSAPRS